MIDRAGLARPGQTLIADNRYRKAAFEAQLNDAGITLIRPALRSEPQRPHAGLLRPLRQIIESVNQTLEAQFSLERHRGRTRPGVAARVLTRILAVAAAIWHNHPTRQPGAPRSLIAYDH